MSEQMGVKEYVEEVRRSHPSSPIYISIFSISYRGFATEKTNNRTELSAISLETNALNVVQSLYCNKCHLMHLYMC